MAMEVHGTDEETDAQRIEETCPSSHSCKGQSQDSNPGMSDPGALSGAIGQPFSDSNAQNPLKIALKGRFQFGLSEVGLNFSAPRAVDVAGLGSTHFT